MTVRHILETKGYGVEAATPDTLIIDICKQLDEQRIGAVIIIDKKAQLHGIVSERDIVRAIALRGEKILKEKAATIMSSPVDTASECASTDELMRMMTERKYRHVPILKQGELVGVVSIGDLVKSRISELECETAAIRSYIMAA